MEIEGYGIGKDEDIIACEKQCNKIYMAKTLFMRMNIDKRCK